MKLILHTFTIDRLYSRRIGSSRVLSGRVRSARIWSRQVGSSRVGFGLIFCNQIHGCYRVKQAAVLVSTANWSRKCYVAVLISSASMRPMPLMTSLTTLHVVRIRIQTLRTWLLIIAYFISCHIDLYSISLYMHKFCFLLVSIGRFVKRFCAVFCVCFVHGENWRLSELIKFNLFITFLCLVDKYIGQYRPMFFIYHRCPIYIADVLYIAPMSYI